MFVCKGACIYMYACVYFMNDGVQSCVCMYSCNFVFVLACVCIYACMYTCMHVLCLNVSERVFICMHACIS